MGKAVLRIVVIFTLLVSFIQVNAQSGRIVRTAGLAASNIILDPIARLGYTSKTFAGRQVQVKTIKGAQGLNNITFIIYRN